MKRMRSSVMRQYTEWYYKGTLQSLREFAVSLKKSATDRYRVALAGRYDVIAASGPEEISALVAAAAQAISNQGTVRRSRINEIMLEQPKFDDMLSDLKKIFVDVDTAYLRFKPEVKTDTICRLIGDSNWLLFPTELRGVLIQALERQRHGILIHGVVPAWQSVFAKMLSIQLHGIFSTVLPMYGQYGLNAELNEIQERDGSEQPLPPEFWMNYEMKYLKSKSEANQGMILYGLGGRMLTAEHHDFAPEVMEFLNGKISRNVGSGKNRMPDPLVVLAGNRSRMLKPDGMPWSFFDYLSPGELFREYGFDIPKTASPE